MNDFTFHFIKKSGTKWKLNAFFIPFLALSIFFVHRPLRSPAQISTNASKFNSTAIAAGNYIWFSSVLSISGVSTYPVTISFSNQSITSSAFTLFPPDITLTFYDTGTALTAYTEGKLITKTLNSLSGFDFLSGLLYQVPVGGIAGSLDPVIWSGTFATSTSPMRIDWKWTAAVYTSFSNDYNLIGIKPTDDNISNPYLNGDKAGTPENYKAFEIAGARSNSYTAQVTIRPTFALPVVFSHFDARTVRDKVALKWTTSTEINNNFFTVERSTDANHFEAIQTIKGAVNSTVSRTYYYDDDKAYYYLESVPLYYRIRQTDLDGKSSVSNLIVLRKENQNSSFHVFPNPTNNHNINIKARIPCSDYFQVTVRDILGTELYSEIFPCNRFLLNELKVERLLSKGLHFITAVSNEDVFTEILVIE